MRRTLWIGALVVLLAGAGVWSGCRTQLDGDIGAGLLGTPDGATTEAVSAIDKRLAEAEKRAAELKDAAAAAEKRAADQSLSAEERAKAAAEAAVVNAKAEWVEDWKTRAKKLSEDLMATFEHRLSNIPKPQPGQPWPAYALSLLVWIAGFVQDLRDRKKLRAEVPGMVKEWDEKTPYTVDDAIELERVKAAAAAIAPPTP